MTPEFLKDKYDDRFVFWGGAVDAQHTLSFGTPEQVREETVRNVAVFSRGGGYVSNNVHNIQATVPTENMMALFSPWLR